MTDEKQYVQYFFHLLGKRLELTRVRGHEELSKPFAFELSVVVDTADGVDPDEAVKRTATLEIVRGDVSRKLTGVIIEATTELALGGAPLITFRFEHRLALTRYRSDIQLFREQTGLDSAEEVLGTLGIEVERRLSAGYPSRHYNVQFRETDDHFTHRMLEEEGVFYFPREDGTVVWGDHVGAYENVGLTLPVRQPSGLSRRERGIWAIGGQAHTSVSRVTLRDWNFETPSLNMDVSADGPCTRGVEQYDFPGEYEVPSEGARVARLMAEAHRHASHFTVARSNESLLAPGRRLMLSDSMEGAPAGEHVVRSVTHAWSRSDEDFEVRVSLIRADDVYRPERRHAEPIMPNPLTGFVVGPEDIHTEAYGRVKVHFHWDRKFPKEDICSWWVPVLQDNTSHSSAIPRQGWEVLVHFLEGDPDRPIVLGRVYNAEDQFPGILPRQKEHTRIQSLSSPTRDGMNEIRFDDMAAQEQLYVHAEKDQTIVVANDRTEDVLSAVAEDVRRDDVLKIGVNQTIQVNQNTRSNVMMNETMTIGVNRERSVGGPDVGTTQGDRSLAIGGDHVVVAGGNDSTVVNENLTESIGAAHLEASLFGSLTAASRTQFVTVGGVVLEVAKDDKTESDVKARVETIGGLVLTKAGEEHKIGAGPMRVTTVGGLMYVKAEKQLSLTGREGFTATSAIGHHNGDDVTTFRVKETCIEMKDGVIRMHAPKKISMLVRGQNERGTGKAAEI